MGIKLPIATDRTQGQRSNDFMFTKLGELVYPGYVCTKDQADPDGGCGCGRAFTGLTSHKMTTTAIIREMELTLEELADAIEASYINGGFLKKAGDDPDLVDATVRVLLEIGQGFAAGTVIERRLDEFSARGANLKVTPQGRHLRLVPSPPPWVADGPMMPDSGVVGGDGAGQSFSVRYTRADIPGALITSYWYPVDEAERYGDDPDSETARTGWDVENHVEYLICTDPENPGMTETWSQIITRNPYEMVHETEAEAIAVAKKAAESEQAEHYEWDGKPFF